jgi:hypothetical protein
VIKPVGTTTAALPLGFNEKNQGRLMVTDDGKFVPMFYKTNDNKLFDKQEQGIQLVA